MIENNKKYLRNDESRVNFELSQTIAQIQDHKDKIEKQKVLPYLVSNVVEIVEVTKEAEEGEQNKGPKVVKCPIIKTTTRQVPPF